MVKRGMLEVVLNWHRSVAVGLGAGKAVKWFEGVHMRGSSYRIFPNVENGLFAYIIFASLLSVAACLSTPSMVLAAPGSAMGRDLPHAKQGVMDLSEWDFTHRGTLLLNGEWELYWEQLLEPGDGKTLQPDSDPD